VTAGVYERFAEVGRDLFVSGAVTSHGGNLSEREGEVIRITRTQAMLGRIGVTDVVETTVAPSASSDSACSTELVVHRAVYTATDAGAVVHAHPIHTNFRSMVQDVIRPMDSDGDFLLGEVPVVSLPSTIGSPDVAREVSRLLSRHRIVVVRGHGPFAAGETLREAFRWVSVLEASCHLLDLRDSTGLPFMEWRSGR
jgi:L-fuculose-phosphate aldolase